MLIEKIKDIKTLSTYSEHDIYLINALNSESGFLLNKNRVLFIIKNNEKLDNEAINTELLSLKSNIYISSVDNNSSFKADYYNILIFNEDYSNELFDTYVELCIAYVNLQKKKTFIDFFYSLINLFQLPKESKYNNLIGLFGELSFLLLMHKNFGLDISNEWHISGSTYDKYDFCFENLNIEIKTTLKEEGIFHLKHKQIFNENNNYIIVINICEDVSGKTLENIYNYLRNQEPFKNNLDLQIKLIDEKRRIDLNQMKTKKYSIVSYKVYFNKNLESIKDIPSGIYELEYNYDFSNREVFEINKLIELVKK